MNWKNKLFGAVAALGFGLFLGYKSLVSNFGPLPYKLFFSEGSVPVLMYHNIETKKSRFNVSPETFRKHLEFLYENNFRLIDSADFFSGDYPARLKSKKPVLLTFDDCLLGQFKVENGSVDSGSAMGVLEDFIEKHPDFGRGAIFFCDFVKEADKREFLPSVPFEQEEQVKEKLEFLIEKNYTIGNHTVNHLNIKNLAREEIEQEIRELENKIGAETIFFAYPFGSVPRSKAVKDYLKEKMRGSFSCDNNLSFSPNDPKFDSLNIPRIEMNEYSDYKLKLINWVMKRNYKTKQKPVDATTTEDSGKKRPIILDPGHGGIDSGATNHLVIEDEVAYDIATRVRQLLLQEGYLVHQTVYDATSGFEPKTALTNEDGEYLINAECGRTKLNKKYLTKRCKIINDAYDLKQDPLLVSIHVNSTNKFIYGASFYYPDAEKYKSPKTEANSKEFAEIINTSFQDLKVPVYSVRFLWFDLDILEKVRSDFNRKDGPSLALFRLTDINNKVLVEVGNLRNKTDYERLQKPEERQLIAQAIYTGIKFYNDKKNQQQ